MTVAIENHAMPFVCMQIHFRRGSRDDPPGKEGLHYVTSQLLTRGTERHSRAEFASEIEVAGASLDVGVARDLITVELDSLKRTLPQMLELLADALCRPAFSKDELDRLRRQVVAEIVERRDNDEALARHLFYQALLAPDPAARPVKGSAESLATITVDDVWSCYRKTFTRANLVAGAAGAIREHEVDRILTESLHLPEGTPPTTRPYGARDPGTIRVILVDKPERTQSQIFIGHRGILADDPRFLPLLVANTIYGGTFTARLSHEIREKRGWSYGAYSYLVTGRDSGSFVFRFYPKTSDTVEALALGLELQRQLIDDGVTDEEVGFAKSNLIGGFPFRMETARRRLDERLRLTLLGLPPDHLSTWVDRVSDIDRSAVDATIRSVLKHDDLTVLMVCSADEVRAGIEALPGVGDVVCHPHDREWGDVGA